MPARYSRYETQSTDEYRRALVALVGNDLGSSSGPTP
jgi:hypothetical protein